MPMSVHLSTTPVGPDMCDAGLVLDSANAQRSTAQSSLGLLGYTVAVVISFLAFVVQAGLLAHLDPEPGWGVLNTALTVLFVGFVPAALIGALGAMLVHLATKRAPTQGPSVVLAGLLGLLIGFLFFPDEPLLIGLLALDTAAGRLAVIPLANRRSRTSG